MDLVYGGKSLVNLAKTNVLLGKNGCGKSTLLRLIDEQARSDPRTGLVKYISPERGGELNYDGNVETNIVRDPNWLHSNRRNNRSDSFRQTSAIEFRRLETLVLRKIEKDSDTRRDPRFTFDSTIAEINSLLDNVQIGRADDVGFKTRPVSSTEYWPNQQKLSSGESELISLAIEILSFCYQVEQKNDPGKHNLLLLDEPDVHLHPDLQHRLMTLLTNAIRSKAIVVVIATHSTAILAGLSSHSESAVGFMKAGDNLIRFQAITEAARAILPIFGAHPLSNVFNERPVLLVEGKDDVRICQQAVRSSAG